MNDQNGLVSSIYRFRNILYLPCLQKHSLVKTNIGGK